MANPALPENCTKDFENLPAAEQCKQHGLRNIRAMWSQLIEHCRAVDEPEPDSAQLLEWEAKFLDSAEIESCPEHSRP